MNLARHVVYSRILGACQAVPEIVGVQRRKSKPSKAAALALLALGASTATATEIAWTGTTDTAWTTGTNWTEGHAPGSTDDVLINTGINQPVLDASTTVKTLKIGWNSGNDSALTIRNGSKLTTTHWEPSYVGFWGKARLAIQDSGKIESSSMAVLGGNTTGEGTAVVDGAGSSWTLPGLSIGGTGKGTLTIQNNGSVTSTHGEFDTVGSSPSGEGTVTLASGGTWNVEGSTSVLRVGINGTGTLNIGNLDLTHPSSAGILRALKLEGFGTVNFNQSDDITFTTAIQGSLKVHARGNGVTRLTANNTHTGGTIIDSGATLLVGDGNASGMISGEVTNHGELIFERDSAAVFSGNVTGEGSLRKRTQGTLSLTGTNSYAGGTIVRTGDLKLGDGGTTGSIAGPVTINTAWLSFDRTNDLTVNGQISGEGSVRQMGSGTTLLTADNTYSGGTYVQNGKLIAGHAGALGSGLVLLADGTELVLSHTGSTSADRLRVGVGDPLAATLSVSPDTTTTWAGGLAIGPTGKLHIGSASHTGTLIFDGPVIKADRHTLSVDYGTFRAGNISVAELTDANDSLLNVDANGIYDLNGLNSSTRALTGVDGGRLLNNGLEDSRLTITGSSSTSFGGAIEDGNSKTSLILGGGGTLTVTGHNTYSGGTVIRGNSTLQVGRGGDSGAIVSHVLTADHGTLLFNRGGTYTFGGDISTSNGSGTNVGAVRNEGTGILTLTGHLAGANDFQQAGSGTSLLTGTNTYSGATAVNAGALYIDGDQTGATAATTVASGATLGGQGIIGGSVTLADEATLSPGSYGSTPGVLVIRGNLDLSAGSKMNFKLGPTSNQGGARKSLKAEPGVASDRVTVHGNLQLGGTLHVTDAGGFGAGRHVLFTYTGELSGADPVLGTMPQLPPPQIAHIERDMPNKTVYLVIETQAVQGPTPVPALGLPGLVLLAGLLGLLAPSLSRRHER